MGQPYKESSDVWALGVILFELLTFQRPFAAPNIGTLILKICAVEYDAELLRHHPSPLIALPTRTGATRPTPPCCAWVLAPVLLYALSFGQVEQIFIFQCRALQVCCTEHLKTA